MNSAKNLPSNRNFGFLFAGVFAFTSAYSSYHGASTVVVYSWLIAGIAMGFIAVASPNSLFKLNKSWSKLGYVMGKAVTPLVLGVIFFVLITPLALVTRLFGRDELRLKKANINSHWIDRVPPGPAGDSFKNQF